MSQHINEKMQNYFISTIYPGTASSDLTANLTKYLNTGPTVSVTNKYLALMVLAANS